MDDQYEHLDALHAEMMAAYRAAEESLTLCQFSGAQADVELHLEDRTRAFKLSANYHKEEALIWHTELFWLTERFGLRYVHPAGDE